MPKDPEDFKRELIRRAINRKMDESEPEVAEAQEPVELQIEDVGDLAVMDDLADILDDPEGPGETEGIEQYEELMDEEDFALFDIAVEEAYAQGFDAYFQGQNYDTNPHLQEGDESDDDPIIESWDTGWTAAFVEDNVTQVILTARQLISAKDSSIAEAALKALTGQLQRLEEVMDFDDLAQRWDQP